jgi:S1-C subfamily serine protease
VAGVLCLGAVPGRAFEPKILDSVVSVIPVWQGRTRDESGKPWEEPEGTAVAIKPGGYLVTSYHVIRRAVSVSVRRADGRFLLAEIIGADPLTDLALLKVAEDLDVPPPGPEPELGAPVCTVGNQFGLGLSVTCGVVSAVHRTGIGFNPIEDFIQTDAVVNPGASGGALIDGEGRLVGVLSAIFTKDSDANLGVNFAASLRLVMRVVEDLIVHKRVVRGRSGLRVADLAERHRGRRAGALIKRVTGGGAAETAGLEAGDVIIRIGARAIQKASDVSSEIGMYRIGEMIDITVVREDRTRTMRMKLGP